jgi:hypothetical protein
MVNSIADGGDGSLRAAIQVANADAAIGISDTINFDSSLAGATITLTQGPLVLSGVSGATGYAGGGTITIDGSSLSTPITISGNNARSIFSVGSFAIAELDNLELVNGSADFGGAISGGWRSGLTINNCLLSANSATYDGGAIYNVGGLAINGSTLTGNRVNSTGGFLNGGDGGAIFNRGWLAVNGSTLSGNSAILDGGGISNGDWGGDSPQAVATIINSTLSGNYTRSFPPGNILLGHDRGGGGIYNSGILTISGTCVTGNFTPSDVRPPVPPGFGGGGIFNGGGTVRISDNSEISGNISRSGGGILNGSGLNLGGEYTQGQVTLSGSTLSNNMATRQAGGIWNLVGQLAISGSTLCRNSAFDEGGGIDNGAAATISASTLSDNSAGNGGGIWNGGSLTVSLSTLSDNHATYRGGAIENVGIGTISGSTVSGNSAEQQAGGGISNGGNFTVENVSSVVNNQAPVGSDLADWGQLTITGSSFGSLGFFASFNPAPLVTCDAAVSQAVADAVAQLTAPLVEVYDDNGNPIGLAPEPVTITLNLTQGTYHDLTLSTQDNVTLVVNGVAGSVGTVNGTTIVGNSPALVVTGGNILINHVAFTTATDAPSILVTGGNLTLRNSMVQESTGYDDAAIKITGGSLNLGTADSPGGNTINIVGAGQFIFSTGSSLVTTVGTTLQINGVTLPIDAITDLISQVAALNLSSGQTNNLISTLQAAQKSLTNANTTAALYQVNAFVNQLNALINSRRLGVITADSLINDVDNLVALIG